MDANNVVLLRGTVSNEPVVRVLPSGDSVTQVELKTDVSGRTISVPVVVHDRVVRVGKGDDVVVTGHVSRRFFRVGGLTQSRTEVVADGLFKTTRKRSVERAVDAAIDAMRANR